MNNEDVYYEEFSRKPKNKFEIGDVVRLLDGDGRPHQINSMYWTWSSCHKDGGWWEYSFIDSGPNGGTMNEENLAYFIDKRIVERACNFLNDNITPVDENFAVVCNDQGTFSKEQFIEVFKQFLTQQK